MAFPGFMNNNSINPLGLGFSEPHESSSLSFGNLRAKKKPSCGVSREKSVFANRDLLIKMISQVFHGGPCQCDCDSSSFALSFCLRAS